MNKKKSLLFIILATMFCCSCQGDDVEKNKDNLYKYMSNTEVSTSSEDTTEQESSDDTTGIVSRSDEEYAKNIVIGNRDGTEEPPYEVGYYLGSSNSHIITGYALSGGEYLEDGSEVFSSKSFSFIRKPDTDFIYSIRTNKRFEYSVLGFYETMFIDDAVLLLRDYKATLVDSINTYRCYRFYANFVDGNVLVSFNIDEEMGTIYDVSVSLDEDTFQTYVANMKPEDSYMTAHMD